MSPVLLLFVKLDEASNAYKNVKKNKRDLREKDIPETKNFYDLITTKFTK